MMQTEKQKKDAQKEFTLQSVIRFVVFAVAYLSMVIMTWNRLVRESVVVPTIYPQFYPPKNISPLTASYILRQGNVDKTKMITSASVSFASKGILTMNK